jgi:L-fucose mutarotase
MIFSRMLHSDILSVMGRAGHGSCVLVADGKYPVSTHSPAREVFLKLRRGLVRVADVLDANILITIGVVKKDQP